MNQYSNENRRKRWFIRKTIQFGMSVMPTNAEKLHKANCERFRQIRNLECDSSANGAHRQPSISKSTPELAVVRDKIILLMPPSELTFDHPRSHDPLSPTERLLWTARLDELGWKQWTEDITAFLFIFFHDEKTTSCAKSAKLAHDDDTPRVDVFDSSQSRLTRWMRARTGVPNRGNRVRLVK